MAATPMFPLGSVLLPRMPLSLRLFEPRYLLMLDALLQQEVPEFGVVLIERGRETGGGDSRFARGTMARIVQVRTGEDEVYLTAIGTRRIVVESWLPDAPWPQAEVRELPELELGSAVRSDLDATEARVRRGLARAAEFGEASWPADVEIGEDPELAAWQLAGVAAIGALDRYGLLGAESVGALRAGLDAALDHAEALRDAPTPEGELEAELAALLDAVEEDAPDDGAEDPPEGTEGTEGTERP